MKDDEDLYIIVEFKGYDDTDYQFIEKRLSSKIANYYDKEEKGIIIKINDIVKSFLIRNLVQ